MNNCPHCKKPLTQSPEPRPMSKQNAIETFGSVTSLATAIKIAPQAVSKWPDPLPPRISDRVLAACVRQGIDPAPLLDSELQEAA